MKKLNFQKIFYEDFAIIPAIPKYTKKIGYINEGLYFYRQRENSTMQKIEYSPKFLDIIEACNYLYLNLKDTEFTKELEYLYIFQLMYFSSFNFLKFNKTEDIKKCVSEVNTKFPNWKNNEYYKTKPFLFKLFCELICKEKYWLVKLLISVRNN